MRFTIMQRGVGFRHDEAAAEEVIGGQEGVLLRLLILYRGHPLTTDEIARHLTRTGRRAVNPDSVPAYAGRLRNRIGPGFVRNIVGGYSFGLEQAEVDAFVYEKLIEQYHVGDVTDIDDEENDYGEIYESCWSCTRCGTRIRPRSRKTSRSTSS